jgi:hypothetical protein
MALYKQEHKEHSFGDIKQSNNKRNTIANCDFMALTQNNTKALCMVAFLMISTTSLFCDAAGRSIGKFLLLIFTLYIHTHTS